MKHQLLMYFCGAIFFVILIWIVQRKKITNRLKHYGRHQLINIDGKPVQQLEEPTMITMPLVTFNYSGLRWVKLKILNEQIHYNIENEYRFLSQVFGAKIIAHKDSGNWITFYFERFKEINPLPTKRSKNLNFHLGLDGFGKNLHVNLKDKSGIRICGRPGSGKSIVLKSIFEQVPENCEKFILTSKPQEFRHITNKNYKRHIRLRPLLSSSPAGPLLAKNLETKYYVSFELDLNQAC